MIAAGAVSGGMLPKVLACVEAGRAGRRPGAHPRRPDQHALLLEILTPEGIGTMITSEGEG